MINRTESGALVISEAVCCCLENGTVVNGYIFTTREQARAAGVDAFYAPEYGSTLGWIPATDEFFQSCARNVYNAVRFNVRMYAGNPHLLPESVDITPLYMGV